MEPLNKGHIGTRSFVLYREVSFIQRLKCTAIIGIRTNRFVLYREVFFIRSVLYSPESHWSALILYTILSFFSLFSLICVLFVFASLVVCM